MHFYLLPLYIYLMLSIKTSHCVITHSEKFVRLCKRTKQNSKTYPMRTSSIQNLR